MQKMKVRDDKYRAREAAFSTKLGRDYLRELSIDELPGLTTPETTAVMLALAFEMGMPIHFVAPAFGFQKNIPYPDNDELRTMVARIWSVCEKFGVSIGFHSGSGKSAENYQVVGEMTGSRLEIKTSGRYTYEMGVALHASTNESDQSLWSDWYDFTLDLAVAGCFAEDDTERKMAREFVSDTLSAAGANPEVYADSDSCRSALQALNPSPDHVFWFEYNFLYVLAADGRPEKAALGDHSPAGTFSGLVFTPSVTRDAFCSPRTSPFTSCSSPKMWESLARSAATTPAPNLQATRPSTISIRLSPSELRNPSGRGLLAQPLQRVGYNQFRQSFGAIGKVVHVGGAHPRLHVLLAWGKEV